MGEKGSLKNLYKSFRIFLLNNKKKKNEDIELDKRKSNKTSKLKNKSNSKLSFFAVLFTIFSFFVSKPSKKIVIKEIKTAKDLLIVKAIIKEKTLVIENSKNLINIVSSKKKLEELKKIIEVSNNIPVKDKKIIDNIDEFIIKANKKIDSINKDNISNKAISLNKSKSNKTGISNLDNLQEVLEQLYKKFTNFDLKDKDVKIIEDYFKFEENEYIIFKTKIMKIIDEDLADIKYNLDKNQICEADLKKMSRILLFFNTFENRILKENIEKSLIIKSKKNNEIVNEEKSEENINKKNNDNKIIDKKEVLEKPKEVEKIVEESTLQIDLKMSSHFINKNIISMENKVKEIRRLKNNKTIFLLKLNLMVKNTKKICLNLTPLFIFNNKIVRNLTSALLLNNSIRSLRRSISDKKNNVPYFRIDGIDKIIKEVKEVEDRTRYVFDDSFYQLSLFKNEFIKNYGIYINSNYEIKEMFENILEIEDYIVSKQEEYEKENSKVKKRLYIK